jgi:hypothetical protein
VVHYQRRFDAHLDEIVGGEIGERVGCELQMSNVIAIRARHMA